MIGMLWHDIYADKTLALKINRAVAYYQGKYDIVPNVCYVHPAMIDGSLVEGVEIAVSDTILPNHLWIGREAKR